jgi:hypothetical protein
VSVEEVSTAESWQIEVVAPAGSITTPPLRLSSMAHVWLSEPVFQIRAAAA